MLMLLIAVSLIVRARIQPQEPNGRGSQFRVMGHRYDRAMEFMQSIEMGFQ